MKKKVGILGGTFDPIHFGHLNLAIGVLEKCGLDEVLFVPASLSPFKEDSPPAVSAAHRVEMVKLAIQPIKAFRALDWEIKIQGPAYTIDTVRKLSLDLSLELHLVLGADQAASLDRWKDSKELVRLAPPFVAQREKAVFSQGKAVEVPQFDISSTEIRARLAKKQYCGHLVPATVLEYIDKHKLYG